MTPTFFIAVVLAAPPVAQEREVSDGIDRPIHDYSGEGDATSIELNADELAALAKPYVPHTVLGHS